MTHTLLFANFKGGVGKTTNSVMTAYELSKLGYKTLVCDLDPQANATQLLRRTYTLQHNEEMAFPETMMVALKNEDIKPAIVEVMKNLYLLPSHKDFVNYPDFLELKYLANMPNYKERRISYFNNQLKQVQNEYDFIIIDVPPTLSIYTDSALYAADNVIIVLQTQQRSLDGAIAFWEYLQTFYNEHSTIDFDILGILPVLLKNNAGLDNQIIKDAKETFGDDLLFNTIIKHMERLKRYDRLGISEKGKTSKHDFHDEKTHEIYTQLTKEILNRLKENKHA
ncbi:ParA family protein [Ligilactobacillus aviarius]|uniref:ATPase n=1 Tax=Ligilactobacillus aviarius TaxID=1606 RepID=A0A179C705_9LACO|nr:AAA family ATPase [Ligilactobacillus aviarius]OAQ00742.1 ATPase [Ligilactobacillus aviarius]OAQ01281.1 ATPase [Ligilactobacillus aviarius]OAQ01838.1 ATPase [Ligilactobacillus aviarius]OAQ01921.1 ATPase [Ligilactobacillus aviarius]OAQ03432.1 ATPase [Ligilactobacillus aviarius]